MFCSKTQQPSLPVELLQHNNHFALGWTHKVIQILHINWQLFPNRVETIHWFGLLGTLPKRGWLDLLHHVDGRIKQGARRRGSDLLLDNIWMPWHPSMTLWCSKQERTMSQGIGSVIGMGLHINYYFHTWFHHRGAYDGVCMMTCSLLRLHNARITTVTTVTTVGMSLPKKKSCGTKE